MARLNSLLSELLPGILIISAILILQFFPPPFIKPVLNRMEGIIYDARLLTNLPESPRQLDEEVVIIDIDEKSMRELGRFPWSRYVLADLVDKLAQAGTVVIAFDMFFPEAEPGPLALLSQANAEFPPTLAKQLKALDSALSPDARLGEAFTQTDVVLGTLLHHKAQDSKGTPPPSRVRWQNQGQPLVNAFPGLTANVSQLQAHAGAGFINAMSDSDGFIRRAALVSRHGDTLYPSLALEAARLFTLSEGIETRSEFHDQLAFLSGVKFQKYWIDTDEYGQILIPYKGRAGSFPYISATDVIHQRLKDGELEGKVAFVGTSAIGLADLRSTPVGLQFPGVEVHANVFETLMHPELIPVTPDWSQGAVFIAQVFTGLLLILLLVRHGPVFILLSSLGLFAFHCIANWLLWRYWQIGLPLFLTLLMVLALASYYGTKGFMSEAGLRKQIRSMFSQYVPPSHIDELMQAGNALALVSEKREMTVMFADIRNFTQISEGLSAQALSDFLNHYLSHLTEIIFVHKGTIDKYVGDMVMAFWNAPLKDEQHAQNALLTALAMIRKTQQLAPEFAAMQLPEIRIGVGINTGVMNVGDMGSSFRKAYTVLGDEVNLGSRVEGLSKFYGVDILVTESTRDQAPDIAYRQIDKVKVKGKQVATILYEPLGLKSNFRLECRNALALHDEAMHAYYQQQWQHAESRFTQLRELRLFGDRVYDIFLDRIRQQKGAQLPNDWDGVFSHTRK